MTDGSGGTAPTDTPATDSGSEVEHDVAVVGGGASGLSAAVFTARYGLETTVFDGGKAAITQCAHVENYLGFPGGIAPDRLLELGRTHVEHEGGTVVDERVTAVRSRGDAFTVETADRDTVADRVIVAAAYDGDVLEPLADTLPEPDPFVPTDSGRTAVDGLYVAGWMAEGTVHQVGVNAGHGARVGLALARDEMSDRYWPAVGERYVDWVVHDGRYGGEGWAQEVAEWFDREMVPDDSDLDPELVDRARADLEDEFLGRCIDAEERRRRDRTGQRLVLEALDDDVIREYVACEIDVEE